MCLDAAPCGTRKGRGNERTLMFGRSKTQKLKDTGASGAELAAALAKDRKFRREVAAAIGHGAERAGAVAKERNFRGGVAAAIGQGAKAGRSATRQIGAIAVARRLATDE